MGRLSRTLPSTPTPLPNPPVSKTAPPSQRKPSTAPKKSEFLLHTMMFASPILPNTPSWLSARAAMTPAPIQPTGTSARRPPRCRRIGTHSPRERSTAPPTFPCSAIIPSRELDHRIPAALPLPGLLTIESLLTPTSRVSPRLPAIYSFLRICTRPRVFYFQSRRGSLSPATEGSPCL